MFNSVAPPPPYQINTTMWHQAETSDHIIWRVRGLPSVRDSLVIGHRIAFFTDELQPGKMKFFAGRVRSIKEENNGRVHYYIKAEGGKDFVLVVPREWMGREWWGRWVMSWIRKLVGLSRVLVTDKELGAMRVVDVSKVKVNGEERGEAKEVASEREGTEERQCDVTATVLAETAVGN